MGSVQNADPTNQYGGVMYSYSTDKIRLWHPNLDGRHFLVYVNSKWGGGNHIQSSESVVAKVSVWKAGQICKRKNADLYSTVLKRSIRCASYNTYKG